MVYVIIFLFPFQRRFAGDRRDFQLRDRRDFQLRNRRIASDSQPENGRFRVCRAADFRGQQPQSVLSPQSYDFFENAANNSGVFRVECQQVGDFSVASSAKEAAPAGRSLLEWVDSDGILHREGAGGVFRIRRTGPVQGRPAGLRGSWLCFWP